MLPLNGALPRHARGAGAQDPTKNRWQRCYAVSLTLFASAILATLVTFGVLNFLLNGVTLPPVSTEAGTLQGAQQQPFLHQATADSHPPQLAAEETTDGSIVEQPAEHLVQPPTIKPPPAVFRHLYEDLKQIYTLPETDTSPRCKSSNICDGDHSCGPDNMGCITSAQERKEHVRKAIAWAWEGYRKYAWGHDEVDVLSKSPHAWFNLGLTIVDSLDTLLIAGLMDEYLQARHWVANHLVFHDGSNVQFFEVNIRILGGLVSAYYLSGGDDLYLHKAEQLSDRLLVAFNTSSGVPVTHVPLRDAAGRAGSGMPDSQTNIAEAGTISMEFTSIGRLLGRDDLFDAGMQFWYVLLSSRNFSGLYCMGIHTSRADCYNPLMTIGSAADSTYEYMLKQWVMSNHTQEVPLQLYVESMKGVRKHLVRHVWDGTAESSIVSEARADVNTGIIGDTNNRFEHLTCFAGGMFVLGALHGVNTEVGDDDFHDVILGARIGRACYELYHQAASGIAPDSVSYGGATREPLPPRDPHTGKPVGTIRKRPARRPESDVPKAQAPATSDTKQQQAQAPANGSAPGEHKPLATPDAPVQGAEDVQKATNAPEAHTGRHLLSLPEPVSLPESAEHLHMHQRQRRLHADADPSRASQAPSQNERRQAPSQNQGHHPGQAVDDGAHGPDAIRAAREREAAAAALQQRLPDQQRLQAVREAEAQQQREQQQAAAQHQQRLSELLQQQQQHQQKLSELLQQQHQQKSAELQQQQQQQAGGSSHTPGAGSPPAESHPPLQQVKVMPPVSQPPPPPPSTPPPPVQPTLATTHQMTAADFLRPETIETLFYLWRATGDEIYREWGWNMFRAFERWTRLQSGGYATINNVNVVPPGLANKMESFWLAETLKYFYLLFEDDPNVLPLDQWVFNTEAHPMPIWGTPADKQAMARLKQRRHAARVERQRHAAEQAAVDELKEIKRQGAALAARGPQQGKPGDRQGYGIGGVEMY